MSPLSTNPHLGSNTSVGELVDKALNRSAAVQVVLRVRPMNSLELRQEDPEPCLRVVNDHRMQYRHLEVVVNRGAKEETVTAYTFDRVVPEEVGQRELFEMSGVQELMDAALHGINVSVFAYGQTGSGKTYTMSGLEEHLMRGYREDDQSMGIISRSVSYLFARIGEDAEGSRTAVKASFSEIYNEVGGLFCFFFLSLGRGWWWCDPPYASLPLPPHCVPPLSYPHTHTHFNLTHFTRAHYPYYSLCLPSTFFFIIFS